MPVPSVQEVGPELDILGLQVEVGRVGVDDDGAVSVRGVGRQARQLLHPGGCIQYTNKALYVCMKKC